MLHTTPKVAKSSIRHASASVSNMNKWFSSLSFSSPESDFTAGKSRNNCFDHMTQNDQERSNLGYSPSLAQAESDYTSLFMTEDMKEQLANVKLSNTEKTRNSFLDHITQLQNEQDRSKLVYSLSFAQAESDYSSLPLTEDMKEQLSNVKLLNNFSSTEADNESPILPTTLYEALQSSEDARVITELDFPFHISSVNESWENLCGYRKDECYGKTLGILQGPETDKAAIKALMNQLGRGETAGVVLTNYTKEGRKFRNRLTVGPLFGDMDGKNSHQMTHLIGVLQEIQDVGGQQSMSVL